MGLDRLLLACFLGVVAVNGEFFWAGGVTSSSVEFRFVGYDGSLGFVSTTPHLTEDDPDMITSFLISGAHFSVAVTELLPNTMYYYGLSDDYGSFTTFPTGQTSRNSTTT